MDENRRSAAGGGLEQTKDLKEMQDLPGAEQETESEAQGILSAETEAEAETETQTQGGIPAEMTSNPVTISYPGLDRRDTAETETTGTGEGSQEKESESETQAKTATVQTESATEQPIPVTVQTESVKIQPESALSPELVRKLELGGVALLIVAALVLLWRYFRKKDAGHKGESGGSAQAGGAGKSTLQGQSGAQVPAPGTGSASAPGTGMALTGIVHGIGGRDDQQDSCGLSDESGKGLWQEKGLFAVLADGMGGLSDGGAVSRLAVSTCLDTFFGAGAERDPADLLLEAARATNIRVNGMLGPNIRKSGSTLVQALIRRGKLYFLTVGDSRIYLYRGGRLLCLNRPHVYAEELALAGVNGRGSLDQVHRNAQKAALTSFVGAGELMHLDRSSEGIALVPGDKILLATDGVFGTLEDWQMEQALEKNADEAARELGRQIEEADKEYQDNYTAVILTYPKL